MPTQTEEQRQRTFLDAGLSSAQQAGVIAGVPASINSSDLAPTPSLTIPPQPIPANYTPAIETNLETLLTTFNEPTAEEGASTDIQQRLMASIEKLGGQRQRKQQLETEAGLPGQRQELQTVVNQLQALTKERSLIPVQLQQESEGRGRTRAGIEPIETGRLRENAIKALSLSAIGQTLQGNISLAQANIQDALDAEFEPLKTEIDLLKQAYEFNRDALERVDKKRADTLNIRIAERERILQEKKMEKQNVYEVVMEAARNGADPATVEKARNASTAAEALELTTQFISAPFRAQQEQQQFQNKIALRSMQIQEAQLRLAQDKQRIENEQRQYDIDNGILSDSELRDVDNSPQGKKVKTLGDLALKATAYQQLVKDYGTASRGAQKAKLEAAYADLKIAYKNAAELGAIQAPDVPIIEGAIRSATFDNPLSQIFGKLTGSGRLDTINAGLDTAINLIRSSGETNLTQLTARNPKYGNSAYVQSLALPLLSTKTTVTVGNQEVPIGTVIVNSEGRRGRVEADGSITPL